MCLFHCNYLTIIGLSLLALKVNSYAADFALFFIHLAIYIYEHISSV